jgi:hypothetical protein
MKKRTIVVLGMLVMVLVLKAGYTQKAYAQDSEVPVDTTVTLYNGFLQEVESSWDYSFLSGSKLVGLNFDAGRHG